jgi:hypothetical protein
VAPAATSSSSDARATAYQAAMRRLKSILDGSLPAALHLDFLCRTNKADLLVLKVRLNTYTGLTSARDNSLSVRSTSRLE